MQVDVCTLTTENEITADIAIATQLVMTLFQYAVFVLNK